MAKLKKTNWIEKLEAKDKDLPKIKKVKDEGMERWGCSIGDDFVIPHPKDVYNEIKKIPKGKLATIAELREHLAKKYKTKIACPLTTGIFAWIAANASAEEITIDAKKEMIPWWRTLKSGGVLNEKYPGGIDQQKSMLKKEGHKVIQKGKKYIVENYEKTLIK